ncbi:cardiolipin synthase [Cardiobacteriaceae bacterium TAE3-ERU3]|nr:cardiolipin synthase [Cardiobacteriaceae bacterium TAE3-ERU3]
MFAGLTVTELLVILHFALNLVIALRVIYSPRAASAALGWLVMLFALPLAGTVLYLLIGEPRLGNRRARRTAEVEAFYDDFQHHFVPADYSQAQTDISKRFTLLSQLAERKGRFSISECNQCVLYSDAGVIVENMIIDIKAAKHSCLLMFYIIDAHGMVDELLEALMAAARRGVNCQLLADDVGSKAFFRSAWPGKLREAGVLVTRSLPVGLFKTLFVRSDLRNHRKLLVVDYDVAYTGSFNLVDPAYFKHDAGVGEWRDAMVRCRGPVVYELSGVFYGDWAVENDDNLQATLARLRGYASLNELYLPECAGNAALQVIPSAPDRETSVMYDTLMGALYNAQRSVVITTPYFVPDEPLLSAIEHAAWRGVDVTLIMPRKVDSWLVRQASKTYYKPLLDAGVTLAMFNDGLLHTKTVLIDDQYALFGTMNMDMRSFYLNMELSLAVYDRETVANIGRLQQSYLAASEPVNLSSWQERHVVQHFVERCVRLVSPLL